MYEATSDSAVVSEHFHSSIARALVTIAASLAVNESQRKCVTAVVLRAAASFLTRVVPHSTTEAAVEQLLLFEDRAAAIVRGLSCRELLLSKGQDTPAHNRLLNDPLYPLHHRLNNLRRTHRTAISSPLSEEVSAPANTFTSVFSA
ncbi:hypothetical protein QAD02_002767 [Eretmocerus hayati]|uniref:Uncharacterized protein n=1 Tax=Eretmocerus hayati TaxID=131215 RepID=A0ACC2NL35_9HYME|nr:hypothetical protein QAD02_002767 [Eretmocerus hayati]